jgi:O-methyltransferase domain/Dimerisation domain
VSATSSVAGSIVGAQPADIKRLGNAFCHAKLLLTATELGLFADLAAHGAATAAQLGSRLNLAERGLRDFLDALVVLGLLRRTADRYDLTDTAGRHLVPGRPAYLGGFLDRANRVLYPAWGHLTEALRTGEPQVPSAADGEFERMLAQPHQQAQYLKMMDAVNSQLAPLLAEAVDWSRFRRLVDVGGARGNLAAHLVYAHPHLRATVFDLPVMAGALVAHMATVRPPTPVDFVGGNFFVDPLPPGDVLVIGHVLHNWSPEERQLLVKKAFAAVRPGGALMVYDAMLDDEPTDLARLVVSLNMLLVTRGGSEYPASECQRWLTDAGFVDVRAQPLGGADTLVTGTRPAGLE